MNGSIARHCGALALAGALLLAGGSPALAGYHLLKKIPIGGEGGWDYLTVDSAARRLYVSHGTHVVVVDLDSSRVAGEIPDTPGVHGIALAPELGRGFISCGRADVAKIFDLKTLKILGEVKTGENPDAILYDPATKRVFTFNGRSKDATAFDAADGKIAGTLPLGGKPEFAQADGKGTVYVNIEDTSEVVAFDAAKLAVLKRYPLAPGEEPSGMAFDAERQLVFSGCRNELMTVLDPVSGKLITMVPIGKNVDGNAYDPGTGLTFSANGEGTLTVIRQMPDGVFKVVESAATQRGARTLALDPQTHLVYLSVAQYGPAPEATAENPHPRPSIVKDTFTILVMAP
jgi:DNA-binding beta-propeller fold protein YncE